MQRQQPVVAGKVGPSRSAVLTGQTEPYVPGLVRLVRGVPSGLRQGPRPRRSLVCWFAARRGTKAGSAASMSETGNHLGIALGTTVLGGVGTAGYRDRLVVPEGVPEQAAALTRESMRARPAPSSSWRQPRPGNF